MAAPLAMLLISLLLFTFLIAIDATSIVLAVSTITADLKGGATESFWVGASYLLSMCLSQPIVSRLSYIFNRKSIILASIMMLGIGSLVCESTSAMALLLTGRTIQGLGAGGLMVLSYALYVDLESLYGDLESPYANSESLYGDMGSLSAPRFLAAISLFVAAGTVCGPFLGAALSGHHHWRWIFRLNIPLCLVLGVLVYNASDVPERALSAAKLSDPVRLSDLDFVAVALFLTSIVPLLVGLSLAGSLYKWTDWQVITLIASGGVFLPLLIGRELFPNSTLLPFGSRNASRKPLLGLRLLRGLHGIATFGGVMFLGLLIYALLFFLPIYYRVVKERSAFPTSLFLLPQTLMMAPCGGIVVALVRRFRVSYRWMVLLGWFCTTVGMGLLALLSAETSAASDIALNLLSGFGIGILMPALTLSAQASKESTDAREALMVFVFMRYLGSASGLVIVGLVFQRVLRSNLETTKFRNEAEEMTKYATTLMYSIRNMSSPKDKQILIQATETTLRTIWLALSAASLSLVLLSCVTFVAGRYEQAREGSLSQRSDDSAPQLPHIPKHDSSLSSKEGVKPQKGRLSCSCCLKVDIVNSPTESNLTPTSEEDLDGETIPKKI